MITAIFNHVLLFCFSFYRRDHDVQEDSELQAFVNELSAQGTGPDGGRGQVIDNNKNNNNTHVITKIEKLLAIKN